jgi:hypothetical protein
MRTAGHGRQAGPQCTRMGGEATNIWIESLPLHPEVLAEVNAPDGFISDDFLGPTGG